MFKAYKFRLYPTGKQIQHFVQAMGCVRYIYNKGLETKNNHYKTTGKSLSKFDLSNSMLLDEKRIHEWLKIPYSQSLQATLGNLDLAFSGFFKGKSKFPKFKKKSNIQSVQYPQKVWVDFKRNLVKIPKAGLVSVVFDRQFTGKIKTCTVSKTATNKFFISILADDGKDLPEKLLISSETSIGIDLGIKDFAILSDGEKIENPKFLNTLLSRLKILQHRASKKKKGSNNQKKANLKVAKIHEKITNQRKDFLHKLSTRIVSENQTIILEDLNVAGMIKNHKLARSISDVSWSKFVEFIKYKSEWSGKNMIFIGRFDPSSKTCSDCGWKNTELKLSDRTWICKECYTNHDRDLNAAINIKNFGLKKINAGQELTGVLAETSLKNKSPGRKKLSKII